MTYIPGAPSGTQYGICFDTGLSGAASAAGQVAATGLQVAAEENARKTSINTAKEVAPTITAAGDNANKLLNPYASTGNNAINQLSNGLTPQFLQNTPGYQWNLQQGQQAATNSAAARGLANSGAALKGASQYASGLADQTYQNQFNDTNALANYGYGAAQAQGNNLLNAANAAGQVRMEGANGAMTATAQMGNALQNGMTNLGNTVGNYQMQNALLSSLNNSSSNKGK